MVKLNDIAIFEIQHQCSNFLGFVIPIFSRTDQRLANVEEQLRTTTTKLAIWLLVFRVKLLSEHDTLQEYEIKQCSKRAAGSKRNKQEIVSIPLLGSSVFLILVCNFAIFKYNLYNDMTTPNSLNP